MLLYTRRLRATLQNKAASASALMGIVTPRAQLHVCDSRVITSFVPQQHAQRRRTLRGPVSRIIVCLLLMDTIGGYTTGHSKPASLVNLVGQSATTGWMTCLHAYLANGCPCGSVLHLKATEHKVSGGLACPCEANGHLGTASNLGIFTLCHCFLIWRPTRFFCQPAGLFLLHT